MDQLNARYAMAVLAVAITTTASLAYAHDVASAKREIVDGAVTKAFYLNRHGNRLFVETLQGDAIKRHLSANEQKKIKNGIAVRAVYVSARDDKAFIETLSRNPSSRDLRGHLMVLSTSPCQSGNPPIRIMGVLTCVD